ncbi:MAG TPA: hypothetical protein VKY38_04600 [Azoarcus sp.]|nr:hypothetical protein [Azoarcus sp.]
MSHKTLFVALVMVSMSLLSACDSDMIVYEPGVYKGEQDETATREAAERRAGPLRERALLGMTDR